MWVCFCLLRATWHLGAGCLCVHQLDPVLNWTGYPCSLELKTLCLCLALCGPASQVCASLGPWQDNMPVRSEGRKGGKGGSSLSHPFFICSPRPWCCFYCRQAFFFFTFILFQYTQPCVNKSHAFCVCSHVGIAIVNIYELNLYFSAWNLFVDSGVWERWELSSQTAVRFWFGKSVEQSSLWLMSKYQVIVSWAAFFVVVF